MPSVPVSLEGWLLKKRRKKMQGFARRYFTLYQSGILSYAFEPGQPVRDQISLHNAAISTAPGRKDIHIDSNTATFHIKCLSTSDFDNWMTAFRCYSFGIDARKSATFRQASRRASLNINLNRNGTLVEEMGTTLAELEKHILILCQEADLPRSSTMGKRSDKHNLNKDSGMFGLFKRPHHHSAPNDSNMDTEVDNIRPSVTESIQRIRSVFDTLKSQHSTLLKAMQTSLPDMLAQTLSPTAEEQEDADYQTPRSLTPRTRRSLHDSVATSFSDDHFEWFDATDAFDGPEEFVMEPIQDVPEPVGLLATDVQSNSDNSSIDTNIDDLDTLAAPAPGVLTTSSGNFKVVRRTELPAPSCSDEGSLFTILKKNIGKDLSTITFPVTFNEPLTLLQRAAEEVEYYGLLDEAASSIDPVTRMSYVAAFAISSYAHTCHRSGRKAFNPMLGETFEDSRMKFIAEKVRHNPLEIAYHAEGEHWELSATSCGKTKFWGKSLEIIPLGTTRLKIGTDDYVWKKPSSFIRNLMVGTKYFEHCGQMTIENVKTQVRCTLNFQQNGYWGPTNVVSGTIHGVDGDVIGNLEGKWDDQMCQRLDSSHFRVLWKMAPFPKDNAEYYGFTAYGITLNEITTDLVGKLPPTDSRYRPDVNALEHGHLDLAEEEKVKVEQLQRDRRNNSKDARPRWFKQVGDEWQYTGEYWEARSRNWNGEVISTLW
ncbi:oxysterol binding protein [Phlegmacium glaucopus]|nr:oxysterol binding protein [Phlegmacium glaucopus]